MANDEVEAPEAEHSVMQLRFTDADGTIQAINAAEVAEVLQGIVALTSDMAKQGMFGDGIAPEVRVRPPKEGSFILEALFVWAAADPAAALGTAMGVGGAMVKAVDVGIRRLRGDEPAGIDYLDNGNVAITWPGQGVDEVPASAWKRLNAMKRPTRKALRQIMAPLSDEAETLEVRDAAAADSTDETLRTRPDVVASKSDYREAALEVDEVEEFHATFTVEAKLQSVDFREGQKWRVRTVEGSRTATMDDKDFQLRLDRGEPLHKNDIFEITVNETRTVTNGRTSKEWSITEVRLKKRGGDDGDSDTASIASS